METLKKRLGNLLAVKSIVTITLTADLHWRRDGRAVLDGVHRGDRVLFWDTGGKARPAKRR